MYKEQVIACARNALREMEDGRTAYLREEPCVDRFVGTWLF